MKRTVQTGSSGFSLVELMIAMTIMLLALGIVSSLLAQAMSQRSRESRTADALATAQAALGVMSREIANSGFGLYESEESPIALNGLVDDDSDATKIRLLSNLEHAGGVHDAPGPTTLALNEPGEDVSYFFDDTTKSIVRYDANALGEGVGQTSVVVNKISNVQFQYFDYEGPDSDPVGPLDAPTNNTGRVRVVVTVELDKVVGQPDGQSVTFASEVTLRNNKYMLQQY
jgi:prepilin-type N-terminal cleavage/methylation domain-containing protein